MPRVQHAWIPAASHLPGGSRHPLRVIPAFGGRSKKKVSFERGPERVFSSSGGGHGTGYWRSHRPQKQRSVRHHRRRQCAHAVASDSQVSSSASSIVPFVARTAALTSFQKKRLAYQRFFNDTLLAQHCVQEFVSFSQTFPCHPPAPLPVEPAIVPRSDRVPMPTLCRLDFGLPLPPNPPRRAPPPGQRQSFPPPPVPPPPPFPPGPPLLPEDGGGAGYWLSRLDRNREAHAENGNTSSVASAPSVASSSQSQASFRSLLFSIPVGSVSGHFQWFRNCFDWGMIRFACVGCVTDNDVAPHYEGYVQLKNSRTFRTISTQFGDCDLRPVPASFQLSNFRQRFPTDSFFEVGVPHNVRSSPLHRANSLSSQSCLSQPSPVSSSATESRSRRWSSLTLSPDFAATVGSVPATDTGSAPGVADVAPSSTPARPPPGFRGYPVLPRYHRTPPAGSLVSSVASAEVSCTPILSRPRARSASLCSARSLRARARSASPFTARSRPLGFRSSTPFSPIVHYRPTSSVPFTSDRRSSSAPRLSGSLGVPNVASESSVPTVARPIVAPSSAPQIVPLATAPLRSGLSIRPSRASFVEPLHNDPGAPGEELSADPRDRVRNICFTENNPTKSLEDFCSDLCQWRFVSYFCIGAEWSSSGTFHFQGYLELIRQLSFASVKAVLPRAKLLRRRGNPQQAAVYCQKDGNFIEYGTRSAQGSRSDLDSVAGSIMAGEPMSAVAAANPAVFNRYYRGMWALRNITVPDRTDAPEVRVFYGATGTGKSYRARQWLSDASFYIHFSNQRGWFDGYQGERYCIFEEFRGQSDIALPHLLMILDRYSARVEVKGTFTMFSACKIAFTSPFHPELWYSSFAEHEDYGQLARRITSIFDCTSDPVRLPTARRSSTVPPLTDADPTSHEAAASSVSHTLPPALQRHCHAFFFCATRFGNARCTATSFVSPYSEGSSTTASTENAWTTICTSSPTTCFVDILQSRFFFLATCSVSVFFRRRVITSSFSSSVHPSTSYCSCT